MHIAYIFVHNMPGYLPESEPEYYDTWDDAKQAVIDYLDREGDHYFDAELHALADECSAVMEDLNLISQVRGIDAKTLSGRQSWDAVIGNVAYSITPDWVEDEDDELPY